MDIKKISLITRFAWAGISTSVLNTAYWWEIQGYSVEIIAISADLERFPFPDFSDKQITVMNQNIKSTFPYAELDFFLKYRNLLLKSKIVIAFDYGALLLSGFACVPYYNRIFYHSLEFFEPRSISLVSSVKKTIERYFGS